MTLTQTTGTRRTHAHTTMKSKASRGTSQHIDLDAILVEIGEHGRYQIALYAVLCVLVLFTSNSYLSYIFTAGKLDYR